MVRSHCLHRDAPAQITTARRAHYKKWKRALPDEFEQHKNLDRSVNGLTSPGIALDAHDSHWLAAQTGRCVLGRGSRPWFCVRRRVPCLSFSPFSPPLPSRLRPRPRTHRAGRKMSRSNIIPNVAFGFGPDGPVRGSVSPFTPSPSPLPRSCSTFADSWGVRIRRQRSWSECVVPSAWSLKGQVHTRPGQ